ncbi:endonuclease/exonuclease/phosphatase family protein [Pleomorphomonas sp. PLEO]|uniref:endonuclease/exonuclease/phosphatase family protein n=1 Tax=Pleomorphomonas sp. PLEO TaxID=3239306 RepID=UPI00351E7B09
MTAFEMSAASPRRSFTGSATIAIVGAVAAATLARFNADSFYYGDLLTFFLPTLFEVSLAATLVALVGRHRLLAAIAVVLTVLNGLPLFMPIDRAAASAGGRELRVATSNVLGGRSDYDDLIAWSTKSGIDVLGQQEVSGYVLRHFDALRNHFPQTPSAELLGRYPEVMAWSGWRILKAEHIKNVSVIPGDGWGGNPLRLELAPPDTTDAASIPASKPMVVVYVLHPTTPRSFDQWEGRNLYLNVVAKSVAAEAPGTPVVVLGDFNTPTWSPFFQSFLKKSGLVDAAGTGWPSTTRFSRRWFAKNFYFGSPVDHILVSRNIEVKHFEVGPDIGSDHLPVLADLRLP